MGNDTNAAPTSETQSGADPTTETVTQATSETLEATTEPTTTEDVQKEVARLKDSLKRANAEAKQHREKAAELDRLKAESEAAKLSETERLQKQVAKLQADYEQANAQLREARISSSVVSIATRLGFADPDDARRFLNAADFDNLEQPTNIEDLLKAVLKAKPYLAGQQQQRQATSGGATNPSRSQTSGEVNDQYVADVMSGKISWQSLTQEQRTAVLNWKAKNPYRF